MNICRNCKYHLTHRAKMFGVFRGSKHYDICTHPELIDPVTGAPARCEDERRYHRSWSPSLGFSGCGPSGKLFEKTDTADAIARALGVEGEG